MPDQCQLILGAVRDTAGPQRGHQLGAVPWSSCAGIGEHHQSHAGTVGTSQPSGGEESLGLTCRPPPASPHQLLQPPQVQLPGELRDRPRIIPQHPQPPAQSFIREGPRRCRACSPILGRGVLGAGDGLCAGAVLLGGYSSPLFILEVVCGAVSTAAGGRERHSRGPQLHHSAAWQPRGQAAAEAPVGPRGLACPQGQGVLPPRTILQHPGVGAAGSMEGVPSI